MRFLVALLITVMAHRAVVTTLPVAREETCTSRCRVSIAMEDVIDMPDVIGILIVPPTIISPEAGCVFSAQRACGI